MYAVPADTQAPEKFVRSGRDLVNRTTQSRYGTTVFREHEDVTRIIASCHRFRAIQPQGILSLAKHLARLSADSIDARNLQTVLKRDEKQMLKSLKSLEAIVSLSVGDEEAHDVMAPLFGIYDLRLADAHLATSDLSSAFSRAGVDTGAPTVKQGFQILDAFVGTLYTIARIIQGDESNDTSPFPR